MGTADGLQDFDLTVIGHFSNDQILLPNRPEPYAVLGGAVAFVSLVTRRLGGSVSVISKVGEDFSEGYLEQLRSEGVDVSGVKRVAGEKTTSFELTYSRDLSERTLRLKIQGSPLSSSDLPKAVSAKAIHIAPIDAEIPEEVVKQLRRFSPVLSLDPQGMTRRFSEKGSVSASAQLDKQLLGFIDVYKSSADEIRLLTGQKQLPEAIRATHDLGPQIVIATLGEEGALLSTQGEVTKIPACQPAKVVDPTGAGDVFVGAFLVEYVHKRDLLWCACVGSAAASLVVEGVGSSFFGDREEIYRRADGIYEKGIKH